VRSIPVESPVALEFNGIGYAVMMATPVDLDDFAMGFSLTEGIVRSSGEIEEVEQVETEKGWLLKVRIAAARVEPMIERVRIRVSESSCGLCGLENLEMVNRPLPVLPPPIAVTADAVFGALSTLDAHQPLNAATGGAHVAAFCAPDGRIVDAREDVGRHCALDKLIGTLARAGTDPATGFFLLSSRCSYELVEKTVIAGCTVLVTISTATSLAVEKARTSGLRLIALARPDAALEMTGTGRLK
jgi:FdhD protein